MSGTAASYTIPTDAPEGDGTFQWHATTLVVVTLQAGDAQGTGYTYSHKVAAPLARDLIANVVVGQDAFANGAIFSRLRHAQRNYGRSGIAATALSAIDIALWDLKAKLLGQPLVSVLSQSHGSAPVYGSGGFTTYSDKQLQEQFAGWIQQGIPRVKMKVGTNPQDDLRRVRVAREAIGAKSELFVDANGAYSRKQALAFADGYVRESQVTWFEEPVSSDDLAGLRIIREGAPAGLDIAAGEYGFTATELKAMLEAEVVDVLQADATRCGGVTGFMEVAGMTDTHPIPLFAHCAPSVHLHLACAARSIRHVEYFYDHARIESMLFDGFRTPVNGAMFPDMGVPGIGLEFKHQDAERFHDDI